MLLLLYCLGRGSVILADRVPNLLIVLLHVLPPALFALVHGRILYGWRGIAVFAAFCLGVGTAAEMLSLRTGFPFGHYHFTDVMGPKLFDLPVLLVLAYLGIGYCSWVMAVLILKFQDKPLTAGRVLAAPALAAFAMLAWDLSMEAVWATVDRAWTWQNGGGFYGVPVSNFFGWYLTAFVFYLGFAVYLRTEANCRRSPAGAYRGSAIVLYAVCAAGNLLLPLVPGASDVVTDGAGSEWFTRDILTASALISICVMGPIALPAWLRGGKLNDFDLDATYTRRHHIVDPCPDERENKTHDAVENG